VLEKAKGVVDEEEACRSFFATSFLFCSSLDFGLVSEWMGGGDVYHMAGFVFSSRVIGLSLSLNFQPGYLPKLTTLP